MDGTLLLLAVAADVVTVAWAVVELALAVRTRTRKKDR